MRWCVKRGGSYGRGWIGVPVDSMSQFDCDGIAVVAVPRLASVVCWRFAVPSRVREVEIEHSE